MRNMDGRDVVAALSRVLAEALLLAEAAFAAGAGAFALMGKNKPGDKETIVRAIEDALESGASTPESYARELFLRGCYVVYLRESSEIAGSAYGIRGRQGRVAGRSLGYPWRCVEERLKRNGTEQR